ncbi:MAG: putative acyl esterase [Halioglobus sp.]|jgi:predicted acyl esterase
MKSSSNRRLSEIIENSQSLWRTHRLLAYRNSLRMVFLCVVGILTACSDSSDSSTRIDLPEPETSFAAAKFFVRESVGQLHVTGAQPELALAVYDSSGSQIITGSTDALGGLVFRNLSAGTDYSVRAEIGDPIEAAQNLTVWSADESLPQTSFYSDQVLQPGFNYITTRDGTRLSAYVSLPGPVEDGPYPTIVNYSGYEPSKPGSVLDESLVAFCGALPVLCDAPNHPAGLIAGFMGYATVGVNMRGTGCSGGAYDYFEPLQVLDGYDIIETIAAQSWVFSNKVGMAGLSYPGISQLFVAQSRPPSLKAIAPLSVIAETSSSTLVPGGIFNNGFAFQWADRVVNGAQPYGQGWERDQVEAEYEEFGSSICEDNQQLHLQAVDAVGKALNTPFYEPDVVDALNPTTFVGNIDVPVFVSGAWQDEQTGAHFATLLDKFTHSPVTRFIAFNGLHADGYTPEVLAEWKAFLDIYVAEVVPNRPVLLDVVAGPLFEQQFGAPLSFPAIPYSDEQSYEAAKSAYEANTAQFPLRIIFDRGAAPGLLPENEGDPDYRGAPEGVFSTQFSQWPPAEREPYRLFLQADGTLSPFAPTGEDMASSFDHDAEAGQRTFGGSQPFYKWAPTESGTASVFVSDMLTQDMVFVGSGSVDLYIQSTAEDADIEVLLSEVRSDGFETYVQAGWLRASQRTLDENRATELRPVKTHLEVDSTPLPPGEFVEARVEIFPFAHIFRAGSRIRLQIDTPGDSRELWKFKLLEYDVAVTHTIAHSGMYPSSIVLPFIPLAPVESSPPPCPSLRGQPCRLYEVYSNTAAQ